MVSVIITNYNHDKYLKRRIDTVLNQTYQNIEVIILDDYSIDNSKEVIECYRGHPKVSQIIYNEVNSGSMYFQWQKGIALARGEYIWIAQSDDFCESSLLETLMDGLSANQQCVLGYVQSMVINDGDSIDQLVSCPSISQYISGPNYVANYLTENCTICNASMAVFKKSNYEAISTAFTNFKLCGDWVFWIEIAKQNDVFVSAKVLNYYRKHSSSVSSKIFSTGNNFIEEINILADLKKRSLINDEQFKHALLYKYLRFASTISNYADTVKEEVTKVFFQIDGKSYKSFLMWNAYFTFLRIKIRRRLNILLKD